jgi:serine/threonine protein phosphatase PrpC
MTHPGRTRESNEDSFFISDTEALCIVADGMGGHRSGEVASRMAIGTIQSYYEESLVDEDFRIGFRLPSWPFKRRRPQHAEERRLVQSVLLANQAIFDHASTHDESRGMGTTVVGAYFLESGAYFVHIGDSRAYLYRDRHLERITMDHSLANEYLQMGILRPDEVDHFPYKNVITRACGLADTVEPEISFKTLQANDIFLFCSDGLTDPVPDPKLESLMAEYGRDMNKACKALVDAANEGGGPDNITVVLAQAVRD